MDKRKKKRYLALIGILAVIAVLYACTKYGNGVYEIGDAETIYLEVISKDEKSVEKVTVEEEDVRAIKEIITGEDIIPDNGFVFAEGGYRIVVETEDGVTNLYPYCGGTSEIRIGDTGYDYVWLEENESEKLQKIINKYDIDREGIWVWDEIKY